MPILGNPARSPRSSNPHARPSLQHLHNRPCLSPRNCDTSHTRYDPVVLQPSPTRRGRQSPLLAHQSLMTPTYDNYESSFDKNSMNRFTEDDDDPSSMFLSRPYEDEDLDSFCTSYQQQTRQFASKPMSSDVFRARLEEKWEGIAAKRLLQQSQPSTLRPALPAFTFPQPAHCPDHDALPELAEDNSLNSDDSDVPGSPESDSENSIFFSLDRRPAEPESEPLDGWESDRLMQQRGRARCKQGLVTPDFRPATRRARRHSWSEPRLWTVYEEPESETTLNSVSASSSPKADPDLEWNKRKRSAGKSRPTKVVHWNERVQVVEFGV